MVYAVTQKQPITKVVEWHKALTKLDEERTANLPDEDWYAGPGLEVRELICELEVVVEASGAMCPVVKDHPDGTVSLGAMSNLAFDWVSGEIDFSVETGGWNIPILRGERLIERIVAATGSPAS